MQEHLTKNSKALVLYSSGIDSTYNLLFSIEKFSQIKVLFFNYYQKALVKEYEKVKLVCEKLNIELIKIDLPFLKDMNSSLTSTKIEVPNYNNLKEISGMSEWVPNRNGVFINIAASIAENIKYNYLVLGFNKEEADSFPDNSQDFIDETNNALSFSTLNKVCVLSFSIDMNKTQILKNLTPLLISSGLLSNIIWSCYNSYDKMCGKCQSCLRLKNAIKDSDMGDKWQDLFLT